MTDPDIVSIRRFAEEVDRSHSSIVQAIDEGRIPAEAVVVDPESGRRKGLRRGLAREALRLNTDPVQAARTGAMPLPAPVAPVAAPGGAESQDGAVSQAAAAPGDLFSAPPGIPAQQIPPTSSSEPDRDDYLRHRTQTEKFRAQQAELDYLRALGQLVAVGEFREATFKRYRALRDKLLNIPDRVATLLAAERDPAAVHQKLTAELKRVLSELSDDARAEAARGAADRVAA